MKATYASGWILIVGLGLCALPAHANLRAPRRADGYLSGGLRVVLPACAVRLAREGMRIVFPAFDSGTPFRGAGIAVGLLYEFENAAGRDVALSAQFVAVDIRDLDARLNDASIPSTPAANSAEEAECLSRLAAHRKSFVEPLYRYHGQFLFFPRWDEPQAKSNIELRPVPGGSPHVRILRGEFDRLPADILTVLVWFDRKAMSSLSN